MLKSKSKGRSLRAAPLESLETRRLFALAVTPTGSGTALSNALVKPSTGITVTNVSYVGASTQAGTFSGFSFSSNGTSLSIGNGVELSTGVATDAAGGTGSNSVGTPGDANLTALVNANNGPNDFAVDTYDANALTITFTTTPGTKSVAFDLIFGSDEFPVYVGSYNDPFGAYLDGKQISFDANNRPITVNNNFFNLNNSGDTTNPNTAGKTPVTFTGLTVNGLTPKITTTAPIDPTKTTHTLKFAIADANDPILNSYVFLSQLRGDDTSVTGPTTGQPPTAEAAGPYTVAAGGTVTLNGSGTDPNQAANTLTYAWDLDGDGVFGETGAAATNGAESGAKPTFNAAGLAGGTSKTVTLKVTDNTGLTATDTATISVTGGQTSPLAANSGGSYTINEGAGLTLNGSATGGAGNYSYAWDLDNDGAYDDATGATPTFSSAQLAGFGIKADGNAAYTLKLQVTSGSTKATSTSSLAVKNVAPTVNAGSDKAVVAGSSVTLTGSATDPAGANDPLTYAWVVKQGSTTVATGNAAAITFTPATAGSYVATLTVGDGDGGSTSDSATVTVTNTTPPPPPPPTSTGPSIISFTLVDADTEKDIMTLTEGATLNRALLPAHLNIRANTNPGAGIKVQFGYDEVAGAFKAKYRTETGAPYALFSNLGSDYFGKILGLGAHTVSATGITYKGVVGTTSSLHFTVVDQPAQPGAGGAVTGFTLVDADKDQDIFNLTDHQIISLSKLTTLALNIRANVTGSATSLIFGYDGKASYRTELGSPFALFSNLGLDYFAGTLTLGEHTLTATPYSGPKGTGTPGASQTITFTVIA